MERQQQKKNEKVIDSIYYLNIHLTCHEMSCILVCSPVTFSSHTASFSFSFFKMQNKNIIHIAKSFSTHNKKKKKLKSSRIYTISLRYVTLTIYTNPHGKKVNQF